MGVVNQAVQDSIGQGRIADVFDPVFNGNLGGNERGRDRLAVFQNLQKIPALRIAHGGDAKVIEDQHFDL